eukprot:s416_g12.t1
MEHVGMAQSPTPATRNEVSTRPAATTLVAEQVELGQGLRLLPVRGPDGGGSPTSRCLARSRERSRSRDWQPPALRPPAGRAQRPFLFLAADLRGAARWAIKWIPNPNLNFFFSLPVSTASLDFLLDTNLVIAELYKLLLSIFFTQVMEPDRLQGQEWRADADEAFGCITIGSQEPPEHQCHSQPVLPVQALSQESIANYLVRDSLYYEEFCESLLALVDEQQGGSSRDLFNFSDFSSSEDEDEDDDDDDKKSRKQGF